GDEAVAGAYCRRRAAVGWRRRRSLRVEDQEAPGRDGEDVHGIGSPAPRITSGAVQREHRAVPENTARDLGTATSPLELIAEDRNLTIDPRHHKNVAGKF